EKLYFYAQDKWSLANDRLTLQPGLRFDYYQLIERTYFSPRFRVAYQLDSATEISASFGLFYQSPGFEKLLDGGEVFDLLKFDDFRDLSAERAIHSVLGIRRRFNDRWYLSIEGYYKKFDSLIDQAFETVTRPVAIYNLGQPAYAINYTVGDRELFEQVPRPINDIKGTAYGADFRLEKRAVNPSDRLTGWLSYSLGESTREQIFAGVRVSYPYDFDRRHSLNVVMNYRLGRKWNFSVTWRFGSGFPFTPAQRVEALVAKVAPDPDNPDVLRSTILTDPETGYARFIPDFGGPRNINSDRYPDYHRLDARLTYATGVLGTKWQFYLDFVNLYDRKNVLFYRNIIKIEGISENLPPSLQFAKPVLFREPVFMYPFIPSLGFSVAF
ncbi:MAG: TonB-dependent receptor plug domain-containing protein, partial [bacterium]